MHRVVVRLRGLFYEWTNEEEPRNMGVVFLLTLNISADTSVQKTTDDIINNLTPGGATQSTLAAARSSK